MSRNPAALTRLIKEMQSGDESSQSALYHAVYHELKRIARKRAGGLGPFNSLSPSVLVNEAYLKLRECADIEFASRKHFFAVAAQCMRWILVDNARAGGRAKRGGSQVRVSYSEQLEGATSSEVDLVALNEALTRLQAKDERLCRVVELRFLVGLSVEETAEVLEISPTTVKQDWAVAKAWLQRELEKN